MSSRSHEFSKATIEYSCLRQYIHKINHLIPPSERYLCREWLKRLRPGKNTAGENLCAAYIERMFAEIMQGYLCSPFNQPPPPGPLGPLPPPHSHGGPEEDSSLDSTLSESTVTEVEQPAASKFTMTFKANKPRPSKVDKAFANSMEFLVEDDKSELSCSMTSSSCCGRVEEELDTRSEPNTMSKLRGSSELIEGWNGKVEEPEEGSEACAQEDTQDRDEAIEEKDLETEYVDESKGMLCGADEKVSSQTSVVNKEVVGTGPEVDKADDEVFQNGPANRSESQNIDLIDNVLDNTDNITEIEEEMITEIGDEKMGEEQANDLDAERIASYYAEIIRNSAIENKRDSKNINSKESTKTITHVNESDENRTLTNEPAAIGNTSGTGGVIHVESGKSKEVQEVFLNKNFTSDLLMDVTSAEEFSKSHHIFDMLIKFANLYEKRGVKSVAIEHKIRSLTEANETLAGINEKYKAEIERLEEKVGCLEAENEELKWVTKKYGINADKQGVSDAVTSGTDATTSMVEINMENQQQTFSAHLISGEKMVEITTKLNALLTKSNLHNEKLAAIDVKFNLVRNDYELERREMILKFKSIDNLHQNILTELVKRQMSETREYQNLIDHYRAQFSEKNAEIARLQNNACEACVKRNSEKSNMKDGRGDVGAGIGEELKLRREIDRLRQTNKELIYTYERKMKRLLNEKYLESRLKDTILKAQRDELELHLNGQKHEELRALAERLEGEYVRVVDEAMKQAVSKLDVALPCTSKEENGVLK